MSIQTYLGTAVELAQGYYAVPSAVTIGNIFSVTINGKTVSYQAAVASVADVTAGLAAAILAAASTIPEFSEITATDETTYLLVQAAVPGMAVVVTGTAATGSGLEGAAMSFSASLTAPVNDTFTTATSGGTLLDSTAYYYQVSAINARGETLASTETSITTGVSGTDINKITVKWLRVPGATGYRVYGRDMGAELYIGGTTGEGSLSFIDTGAISPDEALPVADSTALLNSGPSDIKVPANWSQGTLPITGDDIIITGAVPLLWNLDALSAISPVDLIVPPSFTGVNATIGLPPVNANSNIGTYAEYRPQKLVFAGISSKVVLAPQSGRVRINMGTGNSPIVLIDGSGSSLDPGIGAIQLSGGGASTNYQVTDGSVSVAAYPGELFGANIVKLAFSDTSNGSIDFGKGNVAGGGSIGNAGTASVIQTGGTAIYHCLVAGTMTIYGGTAIQEVQKTTTLVLLGGEYVWLSNGAATTCTTCTLAGGTLDCSQSLFAKTITNTLQIYQGGGGNTSTVKDPSATLTLSANPGYQLNYCKESDVSLDFGPNRGVRLT